MRTAALVAGVCLAATVGAAGPIPDMLPTGDVQYPLVVTLTGGAHGLWRGDVAVHGAAMGFVDGPRGVARFCFPSDLTFGPDGTLYVLDEGNAAIRVVDMDGNVTTLTGAEALPEGMEAVGPGIERKSLALARMYRDGPPGFACFARIFIFGDTSADPHKMPITGQGGDIVNAKGPIGLVCGPDDCLYTADRRNHVIRRVDLAGNVTTLCGGRHPMTERDMDERLRPVPEALKAYTLVGEEGLRDGGPDEARFAAMRDLDRGPDGGLWVAAGGGLRRVSADGVVTTVIPNAALFMVERLVAVAADGSVVIAVLVNHGRRWAQAWSDGRVRSWPTEGVWDAAGLGLLFGCLAPDANGYLSNGAGLYLVAPDGRTEWLLGGWRNGVVSGGAGFVDGWCPQATAFNEFSALCLGPDGCFYAADRRNHAIRKIIPRPPDRPWAPGDPTPIISPPPPQEIQYPLLTTVRGRGEDTRLGDWLTGDERPIVVGDAPEGSSGWQADMEIAPDGTIYVLCTDPFELRRVVPDGGTEVVVNFAAALGVAERQSDLQAWRTWHGEGGLALSPDGSALYVADPRTNQILGVTLADGSPFVAAGQYCTQPRPQHVTTLAVPEDAVFQSPLDLAFGPDGALYVVDRVALRRVSAEGRVTKVADVTEGRCLVPTPEGGLMVAIGRGYARVLAGGRLEPVPGLTPIVVDKPSPLRSGLSFPNGPTYLLQDGALVKLPRADPTLPLTSLQAVKLADAWDAYGLVLGPKKEVILATERGNFLVLPTDELEPLPASAAPPPPPRSDDSDFVGAPGRGVALPDGTLYYLDGDRICRRSPDGKVQATMGDLFDYVNKRWYVTMGPWKPLRDGWRGLAQLEEPRSIVPGPDGALYVLELRGAIRRLDLTPPAVPDVLP